MRFHSIIAAAVFSFLISLAPVYAQVNDEGDDFYGRKYALVIGNSKYEQSPLKNPENDATDIAETLTKTGFKVTTVLNADIAAFRLSLAQFESSLPEGAAVMIFYAGHGVQYQGQNFLIPIGAIGKIQKGEDLFTHTIALSEMLEQLSSRRKSISVVILDACRNSPFTALPDVTSGLSRNVAGKRGLGRVDTGKKKKGGSLEGVVIAYSTAPDMTAADGDGRNSPYAKHLKEFLRRPNTSLETVLKLTRLEVTKETGGQQTPWYETSINGEFYVAGRGRVEFEDLLRFFIPETFKDRMPEASYMFPWFEDKKAPDPINWSGEGLEDPEGKLPFYIFGKQPFNPSFSRTGDIAIFMDGEETHTLLGKPAKWEVTLMGVRNGYSAVGLTSNTMGFGGTPEQGFGAAKFLNEDSSCRTGEPLNGGRVYEVKLDGHELAWLAEAYTCGAASCSAEYILFFNHQDRTGFGCK